MKRFIKVTDYKTQEVLAVFMCAYDEEYELIINALRFVYRYVQCYDLSRDHPAMNHAKCIRVYEALDEDSQLRNCEDSTHRSSEIVDYYDER